MSKSPATGRKLSITNMLGLGGSPSKDKKEPLTNPSTALNTKIPTNNTANSPGTPMGAKTPTAAGKTFFKKKKKKNNTNKIYSFFFSSCYPTRTYHI